MILVKNNRLLNVRKTETLTILKKKTHILHTQVYQTTANPFSSVDFLKNQLQSQQERYQIGVKKNKKMEEVGDGWASKGGAI